MAGKCPSHPFLKFLDLPLISLYEPSVGYIKLSGYSTALFV